MRADRLRASLTLGAFVLALAAGPASAQQTITAQLDPVSGSGVTGTATITATGVGDAATISLAVEGLTQGTSYSVIFQAGSCAMPGASAGQLGALQADAAGRAELTAATARAGATGMVALMLSFVADGDHHLRVTIPGQGTVACGAIPAAAGARPGAAGGPAPLLIAALAGAFGLFALGGGLLLRRR